jgi:hypothetical protein
MRLSGASAVDDDEFLALARSLDASVRSRHAA